MGKGINDVIEDRIEQGKDAVAAKLRMAKGSPEGAVRDAAAMADKAVNNAWATLEGLRKIREECEADNAALGTASDSRQDRLPGTDDTDDGEPSDEDLDS